jgi:uncharacterized protein YecE (DUF72 family)
VGCSGWQYKHWRGDFYPDAIPASRWLEYYALHFDTVEINNSFYRLPEAHSFEAWRQRVPPGFLYAVKASRYITHMKKLKESREPVELLFSRVTSLNDALGPVLYQLPPRWPLNLERFKAFLRTLPPQFTHVVEFRDPTWYVEAVFDELNARGVSLCLHDMAGAATGLRLIGPAVYLRFHGPAKYSGRYPSKRLATIAAWCAERLSERIPLYAYFNNDIGGHAPRDATRFRELVQAQV